jgi:G-patch domain
MSLVCHTIVSRYTPQQRDATTSIDEGDDPWQTESSFGPAQRLHSRPAPSFVPASMEYDEYGMPKVARDMEPKSDKSCDSSQGVSAWYRNLTSRSGKLERQPLTANPPHPLPTTSISQSFPRLHADTHDSHIHDNLHPEKRNWFTSSSSHEATTHVFRPSTLADLLSRNPPPLPSEPTFTPPVFLTIGPSNKGFAMLQRKGWQEGEGLGSATVEGKSKSKGGLGISRTLEAAFQERKAEQCKPISPAKAHVIRQDDVEHEVIDLTLSDESEQNSIQEVVDLTLSDSDQDSDDVHDTPEDASSQPTSHGTTLLTPIATTLKADRLGIGLKAARHSRKARAKAVTHTSAALAVHIRSGHKARIERARRGRGSKGFARARRKEERERVDLLAYMKS